MIEMKLLEYSDKYGSFYKPKDVDAVLKELYIRIKNLEGGIENMFSEIEAFNQNGSMFIPNIDGMDKLKNILESSNITWELKVGLELEAK